MAWSCRYMSRRLTAYLALPLITVAILLMTYFRLFSSTVVIAVLVVLYAAINVRNRGKFSKRNKAG